MLKVSLIIAGLLACAAELSAQSYYYVVNKGVTAEFDMSAPAGQPILQGPVNDGFSAPQTIPFPWTFFGKQVSRYKASDNGYITFDLSATNSDPANAIVPSPAAPNDAIYAFWDNLELSNNPSFIVNDIRTYTVGTSPNRIHVIQWHCTPLGKAANANYLFFALRLYESGDFDVLLQQIRLDAGSMSGTVGCENASGTDGTMVDGSPSLTYKGGVYIKENVPVYTFVYGAKVRNDVVLTAITVPRLVGTNESTGIRLSITNHGSDTLRSFEANYSIDARPAVSAVLSGLAIAPNESGVFLHPVSWQPATPGTFVDIHGWISAVNGQADEQPEDDSVAIKVYTNLGLSGTRNVLIEEFSTAPCGYCPEGDIFLENILSGSQRVIGVTHHSGYLTDAMTIPEGETIAHAFTTGAPMAALDRTLWAGQTYVAISRNDWQAKTAELLTRKAPIDLDVQGDWSPAARLLTARVRGTFIDYPYPGDIRLNVMIVEDSVTGTGGGYDQTNYYNTTPGHAMYGMGDPVVGYVHRHVVRAIPTGAWGESAGPARFIPGNDLSKTYTYTVPATFRERNLSIVAFLAYHDSSGDEILNSASSGAVVAGIDDPIPSPTTMVTVYPNPAREHAVVRIHAARPAEASIAVFDGLGRQVDAVRNIDVQPGGTDVAFRTHGLATGLYRCVVSIGSGRWTTGFMHIR